MVELKRLTETSYKIVERPEGCSSHTLHFRYEGKKAVAAKKHALILVVLNYLNFPDSISIHLNTVYDNYC